MSGDGVERAAGPTRRAVLAGAGGLVLGGCVGSGSGPEPAPSPVRPDPDLVLRLRVAGEIEEILSRYDGVRAAYPGASATRVRVTSSDASADPAATAVTLEALAAEHVAHIGALTGAAASTAASPSPAASLLPSSPSSPDRLPAALRELADLETAASARRTEQCLDAGPELARLLASVAACSAAHATLLGSGRWQA